MDYDFFMGAALKEAQEVIERQEVIRLSPRDWNWLLDLMENPPKPNARLKAALAAAPTRVLYLETISNPTIAVSDLPALVALGHRHGAAVIVDNTFASPALCRPLEHGADLVVESATKYLSGHSDVLAGVVVGSRARIAAIRDFHVETGGTLAPFSAFLVLRGIKTLPVRMERYLEVSRRVMAILERFTPHLQQISVDEAFLDLTGTERLLGPARKTGDTLGLTLTVSWICSGVSAVPLDATIFFVPA